MKALLAIAKALSDPNRVRMLMLLRGRELCCCQIIEAIGLAPSTVSKHLALLAQADLIQSRKEGRWVHCSLPTPRRATPAVKPILQWLKAHAEGDPQVAEDARRLDQILKLTPEELCRRQAARLGVPSCCVPPGDAPSPC